MTDLNPATCIQLRNARRAAKLSQSALARELGCNQSALSMFEQGDGTKLNDETVIKLAKRLGVELPVPKRSTPALTPVVAAVLASPHSGFCPNPNCPGHRHYAVDGRELLNPDRTVQDPVGGRFCALCGEVLERKCPTCGAAVHEGAICSHCGEPYLKLVDR